MEAADIQRALEIIRRHGALEVGLADASIVVLAERHGVGDLLSLDHRHFRTLTWSAGRSFRLRPADG